jgi:hypothetical protein
MAKAKEKARATVKGERHTFTMRLPVHVWAGLCRVAEAKGVSPTSLVNLILANALPGELAWLEKNPPALSESNGQTSEGA